MSDAGKDRQPPWGVEQRTDVLQRLHRVGDNLEAARDDLDHVIVADILAPTLLLRDRHTLTQAFRQVENALERLGTLIEKVQA